MALDYALGRTRLNEIELHGVRSLKTGRFTITAVTIDGQLLMPTSEFWEDLFKRYHLTSGWAEAKSYSRRFDWLAAHHYCGMKTAMPGLLPVAGEKSVTRKWSKQRAQRLVPTLPVTRRLCDAFPNQSENVATIPSQVKPARSINSHDGGAERAQPVVKRITDGLRPGNRD